MSFKDENFTIDSVLVFDGFSGLVGHQILDYVWVYVDGVNTKYWILRAGRVLNNKFVFSVPTVVTLTTTEDIRNYGYKKVWKPEPEFKDGDFLVSDAGTVFYHENKNTVWRMSTVAGVAHASLSSRRAEFGPLKVLRTASDRPFREVV